MNKGIRFIKLLSLLIICGLLFGFCYVGEVRAKEAKQGYAYKDGKLFSIELKDGKADMNLVTEENPLNFSKFEGNALVVYKKEGEKFQYFLVSKTGEVLSKGYDLIDEFKEGIARVGIIKNPELVDGDIYEYGFIDETGKEIAPVKYVMANDFSNERAIVYKNSKNGWIGGAIDKKGKEVIPFKYGYINRFNEEGIAIFNQDVEGIAKQGLINKNGKVVVKPQYLLIDEIVGSKLYKTTSGSWDDPDYGILSHKGKKLTEGGFKNFKNYENEKLFSLYTSDPEKKKFRAGVISYEGEVIVPFDSSYVSELQEEAFFVGKGIGEKTRYALFHKSGKVILSYKLVTYDNFQYGLARVSKGKNYKDWGLIDKNGKEVVACDKDYVMPFSDGVALMKDKKGNLSFINEKGKKVLDLKKKYEAVSDFSEGLASVQKKGKWGYIDKKGKLVIPCKFEEADLFKNGLARIYSTNNIGERRIGLINKKGKIVQPMQYSKVEHQDSGEIKIAVKDENYINKYGYLDQKGEVILPPKYEFVFRNYGKESLVSAVNKHGIYKFGLANKSGKLDKTIKYDDIYTPYKGIYKVVLKDKEGARKFGMLDKNGKERLKPIYDDIENYNDLGTELAVIRKKDKKGIIDVKGRIILPIQYDDILFLKQGAIFYKGSNSNRKAGFMDNKGNVVLKPEFDSIYLMENSLLYVTKKNKNGVYDLHGNIIIPIEYEYVFYFGEDDFIVATKKGKNGLINKKGETLIPFEYEEIEGFGDGTYKVLKNTRYGIIDNQGKIILPVEFDDILLR